MKKCDDFTCETGLKIEHSDGWGLRIEDDVEGTDSVQLYYFEDMPGGKFKETEMGGVIWGGALRLLGQALLDKADEFGVEKIT